MIFSNSFAITRADGIPNSSSTVKFNRDIKPILADKCLACHGADEQNRQGELQLDNRQAAIDAGAIQPNDLTSSKLVERIHSTDPDTTMPPPDSHKALTTEEKQLLEKWILEGAEYENHWAFEQAKTPAIPKVQKESWVRNPIDSFVLAKLEEKQLNPAAEADLQTQIRRVCLDLTGLPPTTEEIAEVLNDPRPDRYEQYVDQLFERESWGEHRARYWLDYARYADTHGIHFDNYREMYSYRDWLIRAFNTNMPFDQFTIEQLAGDLLPSPTLDQLIATGFHRCNITTNEGGIIDEEYVVLYARDRVETTGSVFLGLTLGCAVCHNHKFDLISQKEFYEFSAFFNNTTQSARDGNRKDTPPIVVVPLQEERPIYRKLKDSERHSSKKLERHREASKIPFDTWLNSDEAANQIATRFQSAFQDSPPQLVFHAPLTEASGQQIAYTTTSNEVASRFLESELHSTEGVVGPRAWLNQDNLLPTWQDVSDFDAAQPFTVSLWIKPSKSNPKNGAIVARMDTKNAYRGWDVWLENGNVAMHLVHRWPDDSCKVRTEKQLPADQWSHVSVIYDGSMKANGFQIYIDGEKQNLKVTEDRLRSTTRTTVPLRLGSRDGADQTGGVGVQDLRIYNGAISASAISALANESRARYLVQRGPKLLREDERQKLFDYYLSNIDPNFSGLNRELENFKREISAIESRGTIAHVMAERESKPMAYVLARGDYDKRESEVYPQTPKVLNAMPENYPRNRLGLALWLTSPANPLTSRVTVNRCWQELFGRGIVPTASDFGITGTPPTNQDLLDYLATNLQQSGWDLKQLYRQIVVSSTYRQSAKVTSEKLLADPENVYLSRAPRFRMDAEMVRDYALAVSGLLNRQVGGRSVRPYQPPGVWEAVAMPESDTRNYQLDEVPMLYRRSMYTFWKRAAPPASMEALNAPSRETCTIKRERTNTPLQALVTMNDPQFIESARVMAQRVLMEPNLDNQQDRIRWLGKRILCRELLVDELSVINETYDFAIEFYSKNSDSAMRFVSIGASERDASVNVADLAAWTLVVNQLLNLDEVLCK